MPLFSNNVSFLDCASIKRKIENEVRKHLDHRASITARCGIRSVSISPDLDKKFIYQRILQAIGKPAANLLQENDSFEQEIYRYLQQVNISENKYLDRCFLEDGTLHAINAEIIICNSNQPVVDVIYCVLNADFSKEWLWKERKQNKCAEITKDALRDWRNIKAGNEDFCRV